MKFMTKKWYIDIQKTSKQNRTFMIENIGKFNERINLQDVFENLCEEEYSKICKSMPRNIFEDIINNRIEHLNNYFSEEVIKKVRDSRLLALGKAFDDEYELVKKDTIKKNNILEYFYYYEDIKKQLPRNLRDNLDFHDNMIIDILENNKILEIKLKDSKGKIRKILLKNYKILEKEFDFIRGYILYDEIYLNDNKYELHLLIDEANNKVNLGYFTIIAENIVVK